MLTAYLQYIPFSARITKINVGNVVRSAQLTDDLSERDCFLRIKLNDWRELNLTAPFVRFADELSPLVQTLPLLVFHREAVVDIFVKAIDAKEMLAVQPLLDLVGVLAQDLQDEAYAVMPRLMRSIFPLLNLPDTEVIEVCAAPLFSQTGANPCATLSMYFFA